MDAVQMMDRPQNTTIRNPDRPDPAEVLEVQFTACSVAFKPWWSNSKGLNKEQKKQAAQPFNAHQIKGGAVNLCPPDHAALKALTTIRNECRKYWYENSLPYPQDGLRLIRRPMLSEMRARFDKFAMAIDPATVALDYARYEFMDWAKAENGNLYDPTDYPQTWQGLYQIESGFPSVTPPDYLRQLDPEAYERERLRAMARFDQAVELAEQAFTSELAELVEHLTEKISSTGKNGRPQIFRDSAVENLADFFQRFRRLNVRSNAQLDALVETAQAALDGVSAQDLRNSAGLREATARRLGEVREALSGMIEEAPRRSLNRRKPEDQE
jgi:hypothetical protein